MNLRSHSPVDSRPINATAPRHIMVKHMVKYEMRHLIKDKVAGVHGLAAAQAGGVQPTNWPHELSILTGNDWQKVTASTSLNRGCQRPCARGRAGRRNMIMRLSVGTGAYLVGDEVAGVHEVAGAQAGGRAACDFRPQQIPHRYVHQLVLRAWTMFTGFVLGMSGHAKAMQVVWVVGHP